MLSYLPHEGRTDVRMRSEGPLNVRIPAGVDEGAVQVQRNANPTSFTTAHGYARIPESHPGDTITVRFPLQTEERTEQLLDWPLQIRWRGDTVLSISPEGKRLPLYQREGLDSESCPQRELSGDQARDSSLRW